MSESSDFVYTGIKELEKLEKNLKNYNTFIVTRFINHSKNSHRILDFGAGLGTLSAVWKKIKPNCLIICSELDKTQSQIIKERGFETENELSNMPIYDYIFTSNVLEHISDDFETLKTLHKNLKTGGGLGIFVPANQLLFNHIDRKLMHFRRYSKRDLIQKVTSSGFEINKCEYVDSLGFFAWGLIKVLKLNIDDDNSKLKLYDNFIWPISRFLDSIGLKFLFGKNILLLASKV